MSNSTRTKWMASVISDIFNINEYDALVSLQLIFTLSAVASPWIQVIPWVLNTAAKSN